MANKFQQSVLQRLEQEQNVQPKPQTKTVTKKSEPIPVKKVTAKKEIVQEKIETPVEEIIEVIVTTEPEIVEAPEAVEQEIFFPDMAEYLRLEPARSAKNKTFYLDVEVIEALCSAARRQNVTDSKLCNDILRRVLGIGAVNKN